MFHDHTFQVVAIHSGEAPEVQEKKYLQAIAEHPEYKDEILRNLYFTYRLNKQPEKAREAINEALACAPADPGQLAEYYDCLSAICDELDDKPAALAARLKSVEYDPDDVMYRMELANQYTYAKEYKKAVVLYEQVFSNPGEDFTETWEHPFYEYIDLHYDERTKYTHAKPIFKELLKAAETERQRACMYYAISLIYQHDKQFPTAIKNAKLAKQLLPDDFNVILRLAECYRAGAQYNEAIQVYEQLKVIAESSADKNFILHWYYDGVGRALLSKDKYDEAAVCYEKDLLIYDDPHDAMGCLEQLAGIYQHQRQYEKLKPHVERIIELWPDQNSKPYSSLAAYYLEVEEDAENALNYLFKAMQVNRQSPDHLGGSDPVEAAAIYCFIGGIYHKRLNDEAAAIPYYENALLCKPTKEVEERVCTDLYEIYKMMGNDKRAEELKERRNTVAKVMDMFTAPVEMPPPPDLSKRLSNPKNKPGEIEQLPYYYKNIPTGSGEELNFFDNLHEEFFQDLMNNPAYKVYFNRFEPLRVKRFCEEYASHKKHLVQMAKYHMSPDENSHELILRMNTESMFELILQKKIWDKQLLWRANKISIPEVQICYDFVIWSEQARKCPFIDEVTPEEVEILKQFLADDNFYPHPVGFLVGWQDYDNLMEKNDADDYEAMPPWYEFYDEKMGTGYLLLLPNLRGPKEEEYTRLYWKWKNRQPPDPPVKPVPEPPRKEFLIAYEKSYIEFMELFENDYICKLQQDKMNSEIWSDKDYDKQAVREAIMELELANPPIYLDSSLVWHQALLKAALKAKNTRISNTLDSVYESYKIQRELNLLGSVDFNEDKGFQSNRKMFTDMILKGREMNGEPRDFNY